MFSSFHPLLVRAPAAQQNVELVLDTQTLPDDLEKHKKRKRFSSRWRRGAKVKDNESSIRDTTRIVFDGSPLEDLDHVNSGAKKKRKGGLLNRIKSFGKANRPIDNVETEVETIEVVWSEKNASRWKSAVDPLTGFPYYFLGRNARQTTWTKPKGFEQKSSGNKGSEESIPSDEQSSSHRLSAEDYRRLSDRLPKVQQYKPQFKPKPDEEPSVPDSALLSLIIGNDDWDDETVLTMFTMDTVDTKTLQDRGDNLKFLERMYRRSVWMLCDMVDPSCGDFSGNGKPVTTSAA